MRWEVITVDDLEYYPAMNLEESYELVTVERYWALTIWNMVGAIAIL